LGFGLITTRELEYSDYQRERDKPEHPRNNKVEICFVDGRLCAKILFESSDIVEGLIFKILTQILRQLLLI